MGSRCIGLVFQNLRELLVFRLIFFLILQEKPYLLKFHSHSIPRRTQKQNKTKNKNIISNDQQNKDILNNKKSNNDDPPNTFEIINEKLLSNRPANSEKMHMLGEYQNQDRALSLTFYFTLCIISFIVVYYIVILFNSSRFYRTRFGWRNEDYVRMI